MFGLRQKLLLGFGGMMLILGVIGIQSITQLTAQGPLVDVILKEDYQSVLACQKMKESLQQIDSSIESLLLGGGDPVRATIRVKQQDFESALDSQASNINVPGEAEQTAELRGQYLQLAAQLPRLIDASLTDADRRDQYFKTVRPIVAKCIVTADEILKSNQENMESAARRVKENGDSTVHQLYLLFAAGALATLGFFVLIQRWIMRPIRNLMTSVEEVQRGNLNTDVRIESADEFAKLAAAFNTMAARLRVVREGEHARFVRTEKTTQLAVDSLHDAIALLRPDGTIEMVNNAAATLFELKPGQNVKDFRPTWLRDLWNSIRDGNGSVHRGYEFSLQVFDKGEEKFFLPKAIPIRDEDGSLLGVTVVLADITHLHRLDELKSGLLSTTSHELKTPLTSLQMAILLLLDMPDIQMSTRGKELLESASEDVSRLRSLVDSILDLSCIEAGRVRMMLREQTAQELVQSAAHAVRSKLAETEQKLEIEIPSSTPSVHADSHRINLVLLNLLTNASKYSSHGARIGVTVANDRNYVIFSVRDQGVGIPLDCQPHVFEKFFRVPGQTIEGAGLGLAIAKEIVEAHGGEIFCRSKPGEGSSFVFTLKRADTLVDAPASLARKSA